MLEGRTQIDRYIEAVPKAELHVHLEGSIQPATLLMLALRNDVKLPVQNVEDLQDWFTFRDFDHFIEIYFEISSCLKTSDDYELIAEYTLTVAEEGMNDGVVALGLGGGEVGNPPEQYAKWFEKALEAGLHSTPHAGETVGPESVWGAVRVLGAERLGHGVRSIEDSELVAYLAERHIPLEICPTSNIRLGVYPDLAAHPLRSLHKAGVPVTINSDDPPLFNTTFNNEVKLLVDPFNFDINTIDEILLNGVRCSFLPAEDRQVLQARFQAEMTKLQQELSL